MSDDMVHAPWTPAQVRQLWKWQTQYIVHPFTCGNRENHPEDLYFLIPTVRGWVCMFCDYTQDWCHAMMLDDSNVAASVREWFDSQANE